jgi:NAD(P)-dependent dehydrogenase (short-subunit alcohol dehydrogenase family)
MTTTADATTKPIQREPGLIGQTVVVIGGSSGIGLETARQARAEGAEVILTGRNVERLEQPARELGALSTAAFDATQPDALAHFFNSLQAPIDHVMCTAGDPPYGRLLEVSPEEARRLLTGRLVLPVDVARAAIGKVRPPGCLIFMGATGHRRPRVGEGVISTISVATPTLIANLALELAPVRVNQVAPGFVDTRLSASLLGEDLDARRDELRATLPIGRVVGPADVAALAVHLMINSAVTGATYDIDGGQQFVE